MKVKTKIDQKLDRTIVETMYFEKLVGQEFSYALRKKLRKMATLLAEDIFNQMFLNIIVKQPIDKKGEGTIAIKARRKV